MTVDYKSTVFLPTTNFPMKADLPRREPEMLRRWDKMGLRKRLRRAAAGRDKFTLHDGPPYANGHLHIGHALNKILKDVIVRCRQMQGKDADFVPGWDCHGLPIEWKIEEKYRKAGKDKDEVPIINFRRECREFADKWIDVQREEFKRLGCGGDWDNPYATMNFAAEAQIVRELGKFLMNGSLYKGAKPVLWSVVEKTALAEAEVEYHDYTSTTIWVKFPVLKASISDLTNASIVIWTTTPWTIPGNRAVAYGPGIDYAVILVREIGEGSLAEVGDRLVAAESLLTQFTHVAKIAGYDIVCRLKGHDLDGTVCRHPFHGQGYDFAVPVLAAGFVDTETGTGFVHIAPGHGADDWELGMKHGIAAPDTVGGDGIFLADVPLFAGKHVYKVNPEVVDALKDARALLASGKLVHSYPHSWRSKAPLIFRNTAQWFISMEKTGLREKALKAVDETRFIPAGGKNRLRGMIETRPDWCVSRQRAWGAPIAVFVNNATGEPLRDQKVMDRIVAVIEAEGADAWFSSDAKRFLGDDYRPEDYHQVMDILDVWFDSGCTHSFVLEARADLQWPASLYLEGSDQHRGWFQSSLLESCGTRGRAPFEAMLTHGFVMAEDGHKMSKSMNNVVSPQDVIDGNGADILRLWVVGSDYTEDLRIGAEIVKQHADIYRRLRNTLRFLLGNLQGFTEEERLPAAEMPELERWVLHRLWEMNRLLRNSCDSFQFHPLFSELHSFCAVDLSAFYFDIRKDSLYCDRADSVTRRAARTVLDELFNCLTAWLAPFICFTAEEAWLSRHPGDEESVHLRLFPDIPEDWRNDDLAEKWRGVRDLRRVVTGALEKARADKKIGSSLQAAPVIYADQKRREMMEGIDLFELFITSGARFDEGDCPPDAFRLQETPGVAVEVRSAPGEKCQRCWKVLEEVNSNPAHPGTCGRCAAAVADYPASS
ncbi:MAG: isoleucine--tRNA ligase [Rhodospirillales bacterium RIFCSPLOWO2_12_FULL_58_28]|nr:MAG: isoleucine--tRNA ligase [Rhodospirillales bacterium RIFCSPLOWO2_02_FULL_58_16]OHC78743.1 MAG: isoleucine--tRNA ligase [Rhodospirillales bacterium RIFCSPLOWO2_12_FULL_58_28]